MSLSCYQEDKIDISRLPSPNRCLKLHIGHVNLRAYQLKRSHRLYVELPPVTHDAWRKVGDDLVPDWSDGPTIPEARDRLIKPIQEFQDNAQNVAFEDDKDSIQEPEVKSRMTHKKKI